VHKTAQTFDITAARIVDFHLDLELFIRRLHQSRLHIAFAAFISIAASRMPRRIITDITSTIVA
jgi:hypothetical protein